MFPDRLSIVAFLLITRLTSYTNALGAIHASNAAVTWPLDDRNIPNATFRSQFSIPNLSLDRRQIVSKIITSCPGGEQFHSSHCANRLSPSLTGVNLFIPLERLYWVYCGQRASDGTARYTTPWGACGEGEVCLNYTFTVGPRDPPYAMSTRINYVAACTRLDPPFILEQAMQSIHELYGTWTANSGRGGGGNVGTSMAAAFLLTETDLSGPATASTLQIAAEAKEELFGAVSWRTLPDGLTACSDCDQITLNPVPQGTDRIHIRVVLATLGQKSRAFLQTFEAVS